MTQIRIHQAHQAPEVFRIIPCSFTCKSGLKLWPQRIKRPNSLLKCTFSSAKCPHNLGHVHLKRNGSQGIYFRVPFFQKWCFSNLNYKNQVVLMKRRKGKIHGLLQLAYLYGWLCKRMFFKYRVYTCFSVFSYNKCHGLS